MPSFERFYAKLLTGCVAVFFDTLYAYAVCIAWKLFTFNLFDTVRATKSFLFLLDNKKIAGLSL